MLMLLLVLLLLSLLLLRCNSSITRNAVHISIHLVDLYANDKHNEYQYTWT